MKQVIFLVVILLSGIQVANGQQIAHQRYFVQVMVSSQMDNVEPLVAELRANPNVFVVRYDELTQGLMLVTNELDFELTASMVESWMGSWFSNVYCLRIGLQNVDQHLPFPLTNCGE